MKRGGWRSSDGATATTDRRPRAPPDTKEEEGSGELDNAILLCVQCHADYGHRPDKRAQLRQARDHGYEIVAARNAPVVLHDVEAFNALQNNQHELLHQFRILMDTFIGRVEAGSTSASEAVNVASTMLSSIAAPPRFERVLVQDQAPIATLTEER